MICVSISTHRPVDSRVQGKSRDEGGEGEVSFMRQEAVRLLDNCPACGAPGESLTCISDIPHFKEVVIMAFNCEPCGFKSSEVRL